MKRFNESLVNQKKIIDATLKLFVKKGYHGTSISDISNATKLTKGGIYFHFKNKHAILKAILDHYEKTYLDEMIREADFLKGKAMEKIRTFLKLSINFAAENQDLVLCLISLATELSSSNKKYEKNIGKIYEKYLEFFGKLLEEGRKDGSFRKDINPDVLALNLLGANEGNLVQWSINKVRYNAHEFSRSYMKFFLNGISAHK